MQNKKDMRVTRVQCWVGEAKFKLGYTEILHDPEYWEYITSVILRENSLFTFISLSWCLSGKTQYAARSRGRRAGVCWQRRVHWHREQREGAKTCQAYTDTGKPPNDTTYGVQLKNPSTLLRPPSSHPLFLPHSSSVKNRHWSCDSKWRIWISIFATMATMLGILRRHAKSHPDSYWEFCWKHLVLYNKWIGGACKAITFVPAVSKTARWYLNTAFLWRQRVYKKSEKLWVLLFVMHVSLDTININNVLASATVVHLSLMRQRPITTQTTFHFLH